MSRIFRRSHSNSKSHNSVKAVIPSSPDSSQNGWQEEDSDTADPSSVRFDVFYNHWGQIGSTIHKGSNSSGFQRFHSTKVGPDEVQSVVNYLQQMVTLLIDEDQPSEGQIGKILEYTNAQNIFEKMLVWGEQTGEYSEDVKHELLRCFETIIGQAKQPVLFQDRILNPLLRLLLNCWESCSEVLEPQLILLLHQLCVSLTKDQALLEYFFHASPSKGPAKFLLFSLLIPFIHREGSLGQQARDALLLCISASREAEHIAKYISDSTNLCPVLAGGLGALYSRLPRKLDIQADHWHCLTVEDVNSIPELTMFLNSLEFCNAVVQVAHPVVSEQLLRYFNDGFLVPVVGPALHQNCIEFEAPTEEITTATAYVELFLRSVTDQRLMKVFLEYICRGWHDNNRILDSLLKRIASNNKLCLVTMALMYTLVNINCEDVMMELVFQHLMPCNHIMASQRRAILDINYIGSSAQKFLSLIPKSCEVRLESTCVYSKETASAGENGPTSPEMVLLGNRGRVIFHNSQEDLLDPRANRTMNNTGADANGAVNGYETCLIEYLDDARDGIDRCSRGCQTWFLSYDGVHLPHMMTPGSDSLMETPVKRESLTSPFFTPRKIGGNFSSPNEPSSSESNGRSSTKRRRRGQSPDGSKSSSPGTLTSTIDEILSLDLGDVEEMDMTEVSLADIFQGEKLNILTQEDELLKNGKVESKTSLQGGLSLTHPKRVSLSSDSAFSSNNSPTTDTANLEQSQRRHAALVERAYSMDGLRGGTSEVADSLRSPISSQSSLREVDEPSVFYMYDSDYELFSGSGQFGDSREGFSFEADQILEALGYDMDASSPYQDGMGDLKSLSSMMETDVSFSQQLQSPDRDTLASSYSSSNSSPERRNNRSNLSGEDKANPVPLKASQREKRRPDLSLQMVTPRAPSNGDMNANLFGSGSPYSPIGTSNGQPDTGPFINILFKKLECMMQNSLYMNLLLTGIITRLAYYPQPLLRSFLLNTNMVFQPSIKALIQVLNSVKNNLDTYAATVSDWDKKLLLAKQYLWARESGQDPPKERSATILEGKENLQARTRTGSLLTPNKKSSIRDFFQRGYKRKASVKMAERLKLSSVGESNAGGTPGKATESDSVKTKNAVYCAVVFEEFLKELAATCQEHVVGVVVEDFEQV
ncbi:FHF complex subunit HOOK-interacting protein 1B-like isoform X3 [Apostichopus japonicus]|uniref:FHF complex subunit HOOK-interacting protein 1B-like isoform X3 n=1 Tax=Stichopus japonicus TaxID=307972 RepID=UPI003AB88B68